MQHNLQLIHILISCVVSVDISVGC